MSNDDSSRRYKKKKRPKTIQIFFIFLDEYIEKYNDSIF